MKSYRWSLNIDQPSFSNDMFMYLQVIQWIHLHDGPNGVDRQGDLNTLIGHEWGVNGQRIGGDHTKTAGRTEL